MVIETLRERELLRVAGELLHSDTRRADIVGRYEEHTFAVALPHTNLAGCDAMLARVFGKLSRAVRPFVPRVAGAAYPIDGTDTQALLAVALDRIEPGLARAA